MQSPSEVVKDLRSLILEGKEVSQEALSNALRLYREEREGSVKAKIEKKEKKDKAIASIPGDLSDLFKKPEKK